MLNLNTESLKRPFIPQEEPPQAQKKLKVSGENEHVESPSLNAETIEMLADVIYKLGISLSFCKKSDNFVYEVLSRNTISESDEQIKELYTQVTDRKSSGPDDDYLEHNVIEQNAVNSISKEPTVENLLKIVDLFSNYLKIYHLNTLDDLVDDLEKETYYKLPRYRQIAGKSMEIFHAISSRKDTGPLYKEFCELFYRLVREEVDRKVHEERRDLIQTYSYGDDPVMPNKGIEDLDKEIEWLDKASKRMEDINALYRKCLPKEVLDLPIASLELALMVGHQTELLNRKARVTFQKTLKIGGENEHVESLPLSTVEVLADVIYKLGISLLIFRPISFHPRHFVYTTLSRNTISESDEQIKELYAQIREVPNNLVLPFYGSGYGCGSRNFLLDDLDHKVNNISKEPTVDNLSKIVNLFSEYLENYHNSLADGTETTEVYDEITDIGVEISEAALSEGDTGPLYEEFCELFYRLIQEEVEVNVQKEKWLLLMDRLDGYESEEDGFPLLVNKTIKDLDKDIESLNKVFKKIDDINSLYRKYLPKEVLGRQIASLDLASMANFQLELMNKKARITLQKQLTASSD